MKDEKHTNTTTKNDNQIWSGKNKTNKTTKTNKTNKQSKQNETNITDKTTKTNKTKQTKQNTQSKQKKQKTTIRPGRVKNKQVRWIPKKINKASL